MSLLKPRQAAKSIGIGYQAVLDLIHEGKLPVVRLPGRKSYLLRQEDIDALISGSITGSIDEREPAKTGDNRREPKTRKSNLKAVNADWMQRFRAK